VTAVLVVDGTGRGHAICDLMTRTNPGVTVYYGPGCDVIEDDRVVPVPSISFEDPGTALTFLGATPVEFVLVSNIDALSLGYVDVLRSHGHQVLGPTGAAAALESSKERGKRFCDRHGVPVPAYAVFTDPAEARAYIRSRPYACVVKTDGLTKDGDGSIVCESPGEAEAAVERFAREDGEDFRVVVEERLHGTEISIFAMIGGDGYLMFPPAVDFKRALDGDSGKNCDGMGSVAPHPADSPALRERLRRMVLDPFVRGLRGDGLDYSGFVYLGAMLTEAGPVVIEVNARFGDSEAEVVLPSVHSDFVALCRSALAGDLAGQPLITDDLVRCSVALTQGCLDPLDPGALPGWPFGEFTPGQPVSGLEDVDDVFYANLRRDATGAPVTCGGRVMHVVGTGRGYREARENAYRQVRRVAFPGMRYRDDIAAGLVRSGSDEKEPTLAGNAPAR